MTFNIDRKASNVIPICISANTTFLPSTSFSRLRRQFLSPTCHLQAVVSHSLELYFPNNLNLQTLLFNARSTSLQAFYLREYSLTYQRLKFAAAEGLGGTAMGGHGKTSTAKIRNGAGEATSYLSGESACTHQGAREREMGCVGETDGEDPKIARGGRSGSQGDPNIDGCVQARVWSHSAATTSPRCAFGWFVAALESVKLPWGLWIRGRRQLEMMKWLGIQWIPSSQLPPMSLDVVAECCTELRTFVVFLFLSLMSLLTQFCLPFMGRWGVVLWLSAVGRCSPRASILWLIPLLARASRPLDLFFSLSYTPPFSFLFWCFWFSLALYFLFGSFFYGLLWALLLTFVV